jgi:chitinase
MAIDRRGFAAGLLAALVSGRPSRLPARSAPPVVAAYLASWKARPEGPRIADVPARDLTHLMYAFGGLSESGVAELTDPCLDAGVCGAGGNPSGGAFAELTELKRANPGLRVLISIGGWNGSKYFSDAASTPEAASRFARSVVDVFVRPYPDLFDGVDIDWEYPVSGGAPGNRAGPEDRTNFTRLISALRRKLSELPAADRRKFELTIAIAADPAKIANLELEALARLVDRMNLMAYDYHAGSPVAAFNAPLFASRDDPNRSLNVDASLKALTRAGVHPDKVVLGVPFYGRSIADVPAEKDGLFRNGSGPSEEWGGSAGIDYRDLVARSPESRGFRRHWSEEAQVPWLYNPESRIWISYDDPMSVARKATYARTHGMGGIMIWDLFADDGSLLGAVRASRPRTSE